MVMRNNHLMGLNGSRSQLEQIQCKLFGKNNLDVSLSWLSKTRARCSSVVRAFAHGVMGHWIDPS